MERLSKIWGEKDGQQFKCGSILITVLFSIPGDIKVYPL